MILFAAYRLTAAIADGCAANCRKRLSKAALTFTMRVFYDTFLVENKIENEREMVSFFIENDFVARQLWN